MSEAVPAEQRLVLKLAASRLASEFEGTFSSETIELFLATSFDQFAGRATVGELPDPHGGAVRPPAP